jgi:hypothetical protein
LPIHANEHTHKEAQQRFHYVAQEEGHQRQEWHTKVAHIFDLFIEL